MITLTVTANTAEELMVQVRDLQSAMIGQVEATPVAEAKGEVAPAKEAAPKADAPAKKKAAPKADAPKTEAPVEAAQTKIEDVAASSTITKEQIAEATQKVSAAKNLEIARGILAKFTKEDGSACARISDVQVKDYEDYIATCNATIEG